MNLADEPGELQRSIDNTTVQSQRAFAPESRRSEQQLIATEMGSRAKEPDRTGFTQTLQSLLKGDYRHWLVALALSASALVSICLSAYYAWLVWIPQVWSWAEGSLPRLAGAVFASFFLLGVPLWVGILWNELAPAFEGLKFDPVKRTRLDLSEIESDTIERLQSTEVGRLLVLLRYSRAQLDAYYAMGLQQTRGSYRNAVVAMWLGFLILFIGIGMYLAPVQALGLSPPAGEFTTVVIASAVIIEVIAALFLWTYRSTIGQLTFYYKLQMHSHAAIQSFSIADTMRDSDTAKRAVIDAALTNSIVPERPDSATARGLSAFLK